ncbi:MAG: serine/threonine protein kinase [Myxococcales bacterium]|nr:serine/threonine protein kinase [Myxococcales bacterium]
MPERAANSGRVLGRYVLYDQIGAGGMAVVHVARLTGPAGFSRAVAIKLLHGHLANDPEFSSMFLDEARLAACIRHPNVVPTLDVVAAEDQLFLVMELVQGESLSQLIRDANTANERIPLRVASAIFIGVLHGLHAAHEARAATGEPLGIVHRDVSPQNILVGRDGVARVLDFGIAKAAGRLHTTRDGQIKGKAAYMAPEQLRTESVDARTDVYAAAVVLWEVLTGTRLFVADSMEATINTVFERTVPAPSTLNPEVPASLDSLVLRGISRHPRQRFATAREMALALEDVVAPATPREVSEWFDRIAGDRFRLRASSIADIEIQDIAVHVGADPSSVLASPAHRSSEPAVAAPEPTPRSRSRRLTYVAAAIAALAVAVVTWMVVPTDRGEPTVRSPSEPTTPAAAPPPPVPQPPAPPAPSAAASRPEAHRSRPSSGSASKPKRKPAKPAVVRSCDPPYVIDKNGYRSPKLECL